MKTFHVYAFLCCIFCLFVNVLNETTNGTEKGSEQDYRAFNNIYFLPCL